MKVVSVNTAELRTVLIKGKSVETGLFKKPQSGNVKVLKDGLEGDSVVVARLGGRSEQALCVYPREHYTVWESEFGHLAPGTFGENLTTQGLLETSVCIGDTYSVGSAVVQVSYPRVPCKKLNWRMGGRFIRRFLQSRRVGFYLRVLKPGEVFAGATIERLNRHSRAPTIDEFTRLMYADYWDAEGLASILANAPLSDEWRETVRGKMERAKNAKMWLGHRPLEVREVRAEGANIVSYELTCPYGRTLPPYRGGQLLPLVFPTTDGGSSFVTRPYALSGDHDNGKKYRITVRRGPAPGFLSEGAVSSYLEVSPKPGSWLHAAPPTGEFVLPERARCVVTLSENLGLASVVGLLRELMSRGSEPEVVVFHSDINGQTHPHRDELREMCATAGFELRVYYRGPTFRDTSGTDFVSSGWASPPDDPRYERWLKEATFMVSGSESYVTGVEARLKLDGVGDTRIRCQSFGAAAPHEVEPVDFAETSGDSLSP